MALSVLITTAKEDVPGLTSALGRQGATIAHTAMTTSVPLPLDMAPLLDGAQGVLVNSADGARALAAAIEDRAVRVFAGSPMTAAALKAAGFSDIAEKPDAEDAVRVIETLADPQKGPIVLVRSKTAEGNVLAALSSVGFAVRPAILHDMKPLETLPAEITDALTSGKYDVVITPDAASARTFAALAKAAGGDANTVPVIGPTAAAVGPAKMAGFETMSLPGGWSEDGLAQLAKQTADAKAAAEEAARKKAAEEENRKAEEEARAQAEAERKAKDEADRKAKEEADRQAREDAEKKAAEEKARAERERAEKEKAEKEKAQKEQAERERVMKEQADRDRADKEKADKAAAEKARQEQDAKAKAEKERADKEKAAKEKSQREKAEKEKAAKDRSAAAAAGLATAATPAAGASPFGSASKTPSSAPPDPPKKKRSAMGKIKAVAYTVVGLAILLLAAVVFKPMWQDAAPPMVVDAVTWLEEAVLPPRPATAPQMASIDPSDIRDPRVGDLQSLTGRLATQLQALEDRVAKLEARPAAPPEPQERSTTEPSDTPVAAVPDALIARLAALEENLAALSEAPADQEPDAPALNTEVVEVLENRLAVLERAIGGPEGVSRITERLAAVEGRAADASTVLALSDRLAALEDKDDADAARRARLLARVAALLDLRSAVVTGRTFTTQLDAATRLSDDTTADRLSGALAPLADDGYATVAQLRVRFPDVASKAVRASVIPDTGASWWRQTLDRLLSVISLRRISAGGGDGIQGKLADAEILLDSGDLSGAVSVLKSVEGGAAEALAPWLADAEARLAAESALSDALSRSWQSLTATGTPGGTPSSSGNGDTP